MLWIVLAVFAWGGAHSLLAALEVKEAVYRRFGDPARHWYRLAYNLFATVTFLPVLALLFVLPDKRLYVVPFPWAALMVLAQMLAVVAILVALWQTDLWDFLGLKAFWSGAPEGRTVGMGNSLRTDGLYRYVRHPLYTAGLLVLWLSPWMSQNLLALNLALTVYILVGAVFEERKLVREFGDAYRRYQAQTPMFLPRLGWNKKREKQV
ncbi:MAG: isoprenylcysteine carboxylmethyltransferase family protein [Anaerolineales bacterium]|nr:isoprenylcysteine carboxylmethyltransferase family protein [Anaerolineales bacterium]